MKFEDFDFKMWDIQNKAYVVISIDTPDDERYDIELWSGLVDKNGTKIYENDKVLYREREFYKVEFYNACFWLVPLDVEDRQMQLDTAMKLYRLAENKSLDVIEVVGNIHEEK